MLLPHEIAHQWWGNLVMPANYRSGWIVEALANFAAWQLFEKNRGSQLAAQLLTFYSRELTKRDERNQTVDSAGPLELGIRLRLANNPETWRIIIYDKGTWVIRMLQQRLGEARFEQLLSTLARSYRDKPLSNEAFRTEAARLLPKADPDPTLELFFDTWVYGVGIPRLALTRNPQNAAEYSLQVDETDKDFVVDVPLLVSRPGQAVAVQWVRASGERTTFSVSGPRGAKVSLPKPTEFLYAP
jgi:aminopeptidase N